MESKLLKNTILFRLEMLCCSLTPASFVLPGLQHEHSNGSRKKNNLTEGLFEFLVSCTITIFTLLFQFKLFRHNPQPQRCH